MEFTGRMQKFLRTLMINIYVGNLPYSVKSHELKEAFESFGDVASAEVIFDRRTKRSRGYGFVEMDDEAAGRRAISELNGTDFKGRELRVDESQPKEKKATRTNGNGQQHSQAASQSHDADPAHGNNGDGGGIFGFVKKIFG